MRVFIACSSSEQIDIKYNNLACEVSDYLAKNNHKLVFGGDIRGMMGKCFLTFKYYDAKTKAIVDVKYADNLDDVEVDALEIVKDTFDRLKLIYRSSEVFLVLPGGLGTLSELFGLIEAKRTRCDDMQIIIYNYENYYDKLLELLNNMYEEKFIDEESFNSFVVVEDIKSLKNVFETLKKED